MRIGELNTSYTIRNTSTEKSIMLSVVARFLTRSRSVGFFLEDFLDIKILLKVVITFID